MTDWTMVADGLSFPEGPVACADGRVILVEIAAGI
jgi:gluconolactonase